MSHSTYIDSFCSFYTFWLSNEAFSMPAWWEKGYKFLRKRPKKKGNKIETTKNWRKFYEVSLKNKIKNLTQYIFEIWDFSPYSQSEFLRIFESINYLCCCAHDKLSRSYLYNEIQLSSSIHCSVLFLHGATNLLFP